MGVVAYSFWRNGTGPDRTGLRVDNLLPALAVYLGVAVSYAGAVLVWHHDAVGQRALTWPDAWDVTVFVFKAFVQQLCLLAFLLTRLRDILGRDVSAVLATAVIFAFFHLPNPFLTLYTLGAGLIAASLYLRWPNVLAAALAHAAASAIVNKLLPTAITGGMKVGPGYWLGG